MGDGYSDYMKQRRAEQLNSADVTEVIARINKKIEEKNRIIELTKDLLMFSEPDGSITQGFRTQDIVKELQELTDWDGWVNTLKEKELTLDDIEVGKEYYIRPINGVQACFYGVKVKVMGKGSIYADVHTQEEAGKYKVGTDLSIWPAFLSETKEG